MTSYLPTDQQRPAVDPAPATTLWALLGGNFVIGTGVLAPAGLINELSLAFGVDVATVGTLIAYGGAVLCIESPLLALFANRIDRRSLLAGALLLFAAGHWCSVFAPNFSVLLAIRLIMVAAAAVFTPQASSTLALILPAERRASAIAFIFLGWSLASAVGVPLVNLIGALVGWATVYSLLAAGCTLAAISVFLTLPPGLQAHRLSFAAWLKVLTSGRIWLILAITVATLAGQFVKYPFLVVELKSRLATGPGITAAMLAMYGIASVAGTLVSTRVVRRLGTQRTVSLWLGIILLGLILWISGPVALPLAAASLFIWGSGMSPAIAAQQARLVEADPVAASASVAMNTSVVYLGQALGTMLGGQLLVHGQGGLANGLAVTLLALALLISLVVARRLRI